MELLQIRYFKRVAELEHMTRTAEEFHIAQPSLSKTIHLLEQELGVELFERRNRHIVLSDAGRIFKQYADTIVDAVDDARNEIEEFKATGNATVSISLRVAPIGFPEMLAEFHRLHPSVSFQVAQHQHMLDKSAWDTSDFTIYSSTTRVDTENDMTVLEEPLLLAVPADHRLASLKQVPLREVAGEPLILSSPSGANIRLAIDAYCRIAGFKPRVIMECDDYHTIQEFVKNGVGLSLIPAISWRKKDTAEDRIRFIPVVEPECKRCMIMHWNTKGYISKASVLFRKFAVSYFSGEEYRKMLENL